MSLKTLYNRQFEIEDVIASGGFATIYRARDALTGQVVAAKVGRVDKKDPGYAKAVREEARILQRLTHRAVVKLVVLPRPGKSPIYHARAMELPGYPYFFIMEYLDGGTLDDYLKKVKRITVGEAAAIAVEVGRGLRHVHKRGYVHNDLKLENVVFRQPIRGGYRFEPVLIDFGIATRLKVQTEAGSLYIMAPEQIDQAQMVRPPEAVIGLDPQKVDVWGLGVMLYRMLGGQLPFAGRNQRRLTDRILTSNPTALTRLSPTVPESVNDLILNGCLNKDPHQRLDLLAVGRRLSQLAAGVTAKTIPGAGGWFRS